jgi:phenylpropionate dioxygenase-like ring-hydroxylating dioxygenase large terminal subunit
MEGAEGFDREDFGLPELRSETWQGWIFASFDPDAAPLAPQLAPLTRWLAPYGLADLVTVETATYASPFNWKVLVDNFMEAYHHIAIHRSTFEPVFPAARSWALENEGPYSVLVMPPRDAPAPAAGGATTGAEAEGDMVPLPTLPGLDAEQASRLVAAVVYPFHLFAPSAHALTWYQILPEAWDRFTLRIHTCFPRAVLDDPRHAEAIEGVHAFTRHVHQEDIAACEAAWAGLQATSYAGGRLAPLEKPIWQFNQWWIERMLAAG